MSCAPNAPGPAALAVRDLHRHFGALRAVNGVSLSVEPGERRAIIGPNGAGKTTLFNVVAGELPPTRGQVFLNGQDVTRLAQFERCVRGMGRTFQRNNLFLGLSVAENVALAVRRRLGVAAQPLRPAVAFAREDTHRLLDDLGLADRAATPARDLSHGEQRQLEVALALASGPSVLLLDEPTAGMSPAETHAMTALVQALPRSITVLIIEHDMDVVFEVADRIAVLQFGQVIADGVPEEVRANPAVQEAYLGGSAREPLAGGR